MFSPLVSEFDISQGFSCSADKKYWVGDFDDLRGVTHKVNKVGQHFWVGMLTV